MLHCTYCQYSLTRVTHNKKNVNTVNYCNFNNPDFYKEDVDFCKNYKDVPYNAEQQEITKTVILLKESVLKIPVEVRAEIHINYKLQLEYIVLDEIILVINDDEFSLSGIYQTGEYESLFNIVIKKLNFRVKELDLSVYETCLSA